MARRKTTLSIDEDLLRAVKIAAAREDKPEYQVVEEALRKHLRFEALERVWERVGSGLSEEDATRLAYGQLSAMRRERDRKGA